MNDYIKEALKKAEELGSFLLLLTTRDKSDGLLHHYHYWNDFNPEDIVPSIDASLRQAKFFEPKKSDPIVPPPAPRNGRKLKIAILTHLSGKMPEYYSIGHAIKAQGRMLAKHGHEPVLFVEEGGEPKDLGFPHLSVMPKFKRPRNEVNEEGKAKLISVLREHLVGYDIVITHDFFLDSLETHRVALRDCGIDLPFLHFCRSGIGNPINFSLPGNHRYVYLNRTDIPVFASKIGVKQELCRYCPNVKDMGDFFRWHPVTRMVVDRLRLWDRDIVQCYPLCQTRFAGKGGSDVIDVFASLKRQGKKVCLIFANANSRKRTEDVKALLEQADSLGLNSDEVVFTSTLATADHDISNEFPHEAVADLMQVSNLMVFATRSEVCSNIELESSLGKQLLVLNDDFPSLMDFADRGAVLTFPFTSLTKFHYDHRNNEEVDKLARRIIGQLDSNYMDRQFRHVWRNFNADAVYYNNLEPLLYEGLK